MIFIGDGMSGGVGRASAPTAADAGHELNNAASSSLMGGADDHGFGVGGVPDFGDGDDESEVL